MSIFSNKKPFFRYSQKIAPAALFCALIVLFSGVLLTFAAEERDELKSALEKKNQALSEINSQIKETQDKLESTRNQKESLQGELNKIDYGLKQINLGIKSSETQVEKLGLEIEDVQYDIGDSEEQIKQKQEDIASILRQLQQKDSNSSPLIVFLKSKSLAQSVFETQGLINLQNDLLVQISELENFKNILDKDLKTLAEKKTAKEKEKINLSNKKEIAEETKKEKQVFLSATKNAEKNYQKSLAELQKKQLEIALEIEKIDADLRGQIKAGDLPNAGSGVLGNPLVPLGKLTQGYGATSFARSGGYRGKWHNGVDWSAPLGSTIYSAEKGVVAAVGDQDKYCYKGAYGRFVAIKHENGLTTLYAHLSRIKVSEGQQVNRGDIIGYSGNTGYSTGPHLHFTVYASDTFKIGPSKSCGPKMPFGGDLNPLKYL